MYKMLILLANWAESFDTISSYLIAVKVVIRERGNPEFFAKRERHHAALADMAETKSGEFEASLTIAFSGIEAEFVKKLDLETNQSAETPE